MKETKAFLVLVLKIRLFVGNRSFSAFLYYMNNIVSKFHLD